MSASIARTAQLQIGLVIWCHGMGCSRFTTYIPPDEILAKFGDRTCEEAQRLVRCTAYGTHGRDGKIEILPSTLDMGDQHHGRPPGTSERQHEARRADVAAIIAAEKWRYVSGK